ncbi:YdcF family protein [Neoroseomonas soli]|uniref:YdcF family protein n=1 Tax=Neoroseomonas soli TaxID=1081025 RepID=A0A9X9WYS9_9PROT|nr:YdcF family protein [Neoroseomonas soli]MBR0672308.1 YdcF family protein [Neoroseomonas soli]
MTDILFAFSKILWFPARPGHFALIVGFIGLFLLWRGRRGGRWLVLASLGFFLMLVATPANQWLMLPLEDRFPRPAQAPEHVDGIIVLGGAVDQNITEARGIPSLNGAAERMTEGVILARRYPDARLVFSGGQGSFVHGQITEADVARMLWTSMGIPPERVVYEDAARNTHENAVFTHRLVNPKPGEVWLLVTSAAHMPRSVAVFRGAGWRGIVPWPVNYRTGHSWTVWYDAPFPERLGQFEWAFREWLGLVAYYLMGRTESVLPAR